MLIIYRSKRRMKQNYLSMNKTEFEKLFELGESLRQGREKRIRRYLINEFEELFGLFGAERLKIVLVALTARKFALQRVEMLLCKLQFAHHSMLETH